MFRVCPKGYRGSAKHQQRNELLMVFLVLLAGVVEAYDPGRK